MNLLDTAAEAYYAGEPVMTDAEFDRLAAAARRRSVGARSGAKIPHTSPMLSLRREYEPEAWIAALGSPVIVQLKVDGMAAALTFERGRLVLALSRGDGRLGCDITAAVADSGAVAAGFEGFTGEVRGELFTPASAWLACGRYASPQADVAALVRAGRTAGSGIRFMPHDAAPAADLSFAGWTGIVNDIPCDGVVIKAADEAVRRTLGDDGFVPQWAVCVKP